MTESDQEFSNLKSGTISDDSCAIVCLDGTFDIFMGTNRSYDAYFDHRCFVEASRFEEHWKYAFSRLQESGATGMSVVIPNKTSVRDVYPLWLPRDGSPVVRYLGKRQEENSKLSLIGPRELFVLLESSDCWLPYDSHWSPIGALAVAELILQKLSRTRVSLVELSDFTYYGDLSPHFGILHRSHTLRQPVAIYSPSILVHGDGDSFYIGKSSQIFNEQAPDGSLLIVGTSSSGTGESPMNLTYWLSQAFRRTTFLWSGYLPANLNYSDYTHVIYAGAERFVARVNQIPFKYDFPIESNDFFDSLDKTARDAQC
jgi:hypothetical protein